MSNLDSICYLNSFCPETSHSLRFRGLGCGRFCGVHCPASHRGWGLWAVFEARIIVGVQASGPYRRGFLCLFHGFFQKHFPIYLSKPIVVKLGGSLNLSDVTSVCCSILLTGMTSEDNIYGGYFIGHKTPKPLRDDHSHSTPAGDPEYNLLLHSFRSSLGREFI